MSLLRPGLATATCVLAMLGAAACAPVPAAAQPLIDLSAGPTNSERGGNAEFGFGVGCAFWARSWISLQTRLDATRVTRNDGITTLTAGPRVSYPAGRTHPYADVVFGFSGPSTNYSGVVIGFGGGVAMDLGDRVGLILSAHRITSANIENIAELTEYRGGMTVSPRGRSNPR